MTPYARNARLYKTLLAMGLVVDRICADGNPEKIDCLVVSSDPRRRLQLTIAGEVGSPVKGAEIVDVVSSPVSDRNNMVDFPTKL